MGWLRKTWVALAALLTRQGTSSDLRSSPPAELVGDTGIQVGPQTGPMQNCTAPQNPDLGSAPVAASRSPNLGNAQAIDNGQVFGCTPRSSDVRNDHTPDLAYAPDSPLKALLDQMEKAFPAPSIKPGSDMASLQYAAGQRAVVDWVRMKQKRGQA